jgi:hypothetical protein
MHRSLALAVFTTVTALLVGTPALGQVETTPIPVPPKPDFSSMQFLIGTWVCSETNTRRATAYGSTITNTMDPSGYWMITKTINHASSFDPHPTTNMDQTTYDAANSRWVDIGTDNEGGYGASTSAGWNGNTIVWHPVGMTSVGSGNVVGAGDTTTTKVSSKKYTYTGSFKERGGRTITLKGTCNKSTSQM